MREAAGQAMKDNVWPDRLDFVTIYVTIVTKIVTRRKHAF
jgi:hypothetical protein